MKTKGALVWDFHQPWSVEEIEIGDPARVRSRWRSRPPACVTPTITS